MSFREVIALVLVIAGTALELLSVLGLCVMRLICVAVVFRESFSLIGDKALLVAVVLVVSGPVLVHSTARSLLSHELGDWRKKADELEREER